MGMDFLDIYRHLLPRNKNGTGSEAFKLEDGTLHKNLYIGLTTFPQDMKDFMDGIFLDIFPKTTRALDEWSETFDLWPTERTEQETRDTLTALWRATGGQSPQYLQDRLQEAGFNVFVHDWWGAVLPADTTIFEYINRCYYTNGFYPGTSEFVESRATSAWKERDGQIIEFDPFVIRDGGDLGLLTEPSRVQLLRNPVDMTSSPWVKSGTLTVVREALFEPFLVEKTNRVSPGAVGDRLEQFVPVTAETDYVVSWYARNVDATDVSYLIYDETNGANIIAETSYFADINDTGFTRIEVPFTTPAGCTEVRLQIVRSLAGGDIYVDTAQFEIGLFATSLIPFAGSILKTSATVVDTFTYDTRYDSDGGAWRFNTDGTSWYAELGEFPERVSIVAENNTLLSFYDTTVPGNPTYMDFEMGGSFGAGTAMLLGNGNISSVKMNDGLLCVSQTGSVNSALVLIDFIKDEVKYRRQTGVATIPRTISQRNNGDIASADVVFSGVGLVDNIINDVAITAVDGAEIDASRLNLPYPTIAVATNGGASVINHDGSAANENDVVDVTFNINSNSKNVEFDSQELLYISQRFITDGDAYIHPLEIPNADVVRINGEDCVTQGTAGATGFFIRVPSSGNDRFKKSLVNGNLTGLQNGLMFVDLDKSALPNSLPNSMVQHTSINYASGVIPGDIRGAWMADTETGDIGAELVTNGTFDSGTANWNANPGATISVVSGEFKVDQGVTHDFVVAYQAITTEVGKTYALYHDLISDGTSVGSGQVYVRTAPTSGNIAISASGFGTGILTFFTATTTTTYICPGHGSSADNIYALFDNITVTEVIEDRSVKGNDLTIVNGPLTRNAVATGADLVWWEGFVGPELVTNGTFDTDTDWTKFGSLTAISGGQLTVGGVGGNGTAYQLVGLTIGRTYRLDYELVSKDNSAVILLLNDSGASSSTAVATLHPVGPASGDFTVYFTATGPYLNLFVGGGDFQAVFDNVSVKAYSHAELGYTADLDYGTADFSDIGWMAADVDGSIRTYWMRSDTGITGGSIRQQINVDGTVTFTISDDGETTPYSVTSTTSVDDGNPHFVAVGRRGFTLELWIDDVLEDELILGAWDITNAAYASKSLDVSTEETIPNGIYLSTDETTMYVIGRGSDAVYQYTMTTVGDLSTASYASKSFDVSTQSEDPEDVTFSADRTKMFVLDRLDTEIYQYTLSTPGDVSTASYDSVSFDTSSQAAVPIGMFLTDDGSTLYISDNNTDTVYQYTLSTANDLSTASYASKSFSVATQATEPAGVSFSVDGTKMYVTDNATDTVYQYTLSTPGDVNTASYDTISFSVAAQDTNPQSCAFFKRDGTGFYVAGILNDTVYQYDVNGVAVDLDNGTAVLNIGQAVDGTQPATDVKLTLQRTSAYMPTVEQLGIIYDFEQSWFDADALITLGGTSNSVQDISYDFVLNQARVATPSGVTVFDLTTRKRVEFISTEVATSVNHGSVSAVDGYMTAGTTAEAYVLSDSGMRGADNVTIDLSTVDWFTDDQIFTVVAAVIFTGSDIASPELFAFNDGTTDNEVVVYLNGSNEPTLRVVSGGVTQADISSGVAISTGVEFNVAIRVEADNMAISVDGAAVVADILGIAPVGLDTLSQGDTEAAQYLRSFEYRPVTSTDAELVTYSTNGPDACIAPDPLTVNVIGSQFAPFTSECGEAEALCGNDIYCGDQVVIAAGTYPTIRNPLKVLNDENHIAYTAVCGDPESMCGSGVECGDTYVLDGYPLVNSIYESFPAYAETIMCGGVGAECGEPLVQCGTFGSGFDFRLKQYIIPSEVLKWPHFVYVGGETWPELAQVSAARREEFETMILKLFPEHKWVGVLVEYV